MIKNPLNNNTFVLLLCYHSSDACRILLCTHTETDPFRPRSKATILLSHKPGLDVEGDDKLLIGSRKLLEGCPRPLQSHYIEHFKGHFVLMDQVLTQTALSAVLVRTTNTAGRKQAQEIK